MPRDISWVAPDGTTLRLTDRGLGYRLQDATRGLDNVTYRYTAESYAGEDGEEPQQIVAGAREVTLALLIEADDEDTLTARTRALVRAMRPKAGPGRLVVADAYGRVRTLTGVRYQGGLEGEETRDAKIHGRWAKRIVKLRATDPWFYGPPVLVDFGLPVPSIFLSKTLPLPRMLSASTIQGQQDIDLTDADAPSYPLWTITGPGTGVTLTNHTTGRTIQLNASIGDGQTVVIDTRPGRQSVRRGDGANLMGNLASDPALWPLVDGAVNDGTATLGAAGANARIRGSYAIRYAGG